MTETGHSTSGLYTLVYILCPTMPMPTIPIHVVIHTISTTTSTIVWEPETIVGNLMCMCGGGCPRVGGGQRYVSLGFASGLSTDRNIPWEIWLDLAKKDNNRSKPFGLQTRNALNL